MLRMVLVLGVLAPCAAGCWVHAHGRHDDVYVEPAHRERDEHREERREERHEERRDDDRR
ncbi:MAG TPA: hypothetical protein VE987_03130 [Polyangiaceae bacterium]|nr:hypothetical protein [Polyangiaceae bacterium]